MSIPKTREVLEEHLFAKVKFMFPTLAEKVTKILCDGKMDEDIIRLLSLDPWLEENVDDIILKLDREDKEAYGEEIFQAVVSIEQELSAQVTGMLLELPPSVVIRLLNSKVDLQAAVVKAKKEYLCFLQNGSTCNNSSSSKKNKCYGNTDQRKIEEIGQEIYDKLVYRYPSQASKLTGMLLQMEPQTLNEALSDPKVFDGKVRLALSALQKT